MKRFVPREKMSKKAQKELAAERRGTWAFSTVTRKIDSKKNYNRKRISRTRYEDDREILFCFLCVTPACRRRISEEHRAVSGAES